EGATKLITVNVSGAKSISEARRIGKTIVSSSLVKSAIFGEDANFGRIITAIGYSGCNIEPHQTYVQLNHIPVVDKGMAV
ncbi:bifunctional ornithine acetyltransferase/N-acetylglutamate synthase, partial [Staphylococcus aureus]